MKARNFLKQYRRGFVFFTMESVFCFHVNLLSSTIPRYFKVSTRSTSFSFITIKSGTLVCLRKSITISLVFVTLRNRWLESHQSTKDITSCVYLIKTVNQNHTRHTPQNSVIRMFVKWQNTKPIMCVCFDTMDPEGMTRNRQQTCRQTISCPCLGRFLLYF